MFLLVCQKFQMLLVLVRLAVSAMLLSLGILQTKIFLLGRWTILLTFRAVGAVSCCFLRTGCNGCYFRSLNLLRVDRPITAKLQWHHFSIPT